jgi:hypothetical protein
MRDHAPRRRRWARGDVGGHEDRFDDEWAVHGIDWPIRATVDVTFEPLDGGERSRVTTSRGTASASCSCHSSSAGTRAARCRQTCPGSSSVSRKPRAPSRSVRTWCPVSAVAVQPDADLLSLPTSKGGRSQLRASWRATEPILWLFPTRRIRRDRSGRISRTGRNWPYGTWFRGTHNPSRGGSNPPPAHQEMPANFLFAPLGRRF